MKLKKAIDIILHPTPSHIHGKDIIEAKESLIIFFENYAKKIRETTAPPDPTVGDILIAILKIKNFKEEKIYENYSES